MNATTSASAHSGLTPDGALEPTQSSHSHAAHPTAAEDETMTTDLQHGPNATEPHGRADATPQPTMGTNRTWTQTVARRLPRCGSRGWRVCFTS